VTRQAVRGISAPPEVVFDTATDPDRHGAWVPSDLWVDRSDPDRLEVRLTAASGGQAGTLRVRPGDSGGSSVELRFEDGSAGGSPDDILRALDREVADNFNAG
jgi:hypothetical protein